MTDLQEELTIKERIKLLEANKEDLFPHELTHLEELKELDDE